MLPDADWERVPPSPHSRPGPRVALPPEQLPEVVELLADGWELLPESPLWAFLPAIWPPSLATWVADRATRWMVEDVDGSRRVLEWPPAEYLNWAADLSLSCRDAGVGERPPGRLWLLKAVDGATLASYLSAVLARCRAQRIPTHPSPELTQVAAGLLEA